MIKILRRTVKDEKIKEVNKLERGCWVYAVDPLADSEDMSFLTTKIEIEKDFIYDTLDMDELPRIETVNGDIYFLTQVPFEIEGSITTVPLAVIITKDYIVTVCKYKLQMLESYIEGKAGFYTTQKTKFLIQILAKVTKLYDKEIKKISKDIKHKRINLKELKNDDIVYLVEMEDVLNNFTTNLVTTINNFERILTSKIIKLYREDENIINDLVIDDKQTLDLCKTSSKLIVNIRNAYSTILTNNLNRTIKFLTAITIILTVPTIIASIYGMNVNLPLRESPFAFTYVLIIIFIFMVPLLFIFYKKEWL